MPAGLWRELLSQASTLRGAPQVEVAPQRVLQWSSWETGGQTPRGLQLVDFYPVTTIREAPQWGRTAAVHVQPLEAFQAAVSAHRKANDDHIRVTGARDGRGPEL